MKLAQKRMSAAIARERIIHRSAVSRSFARVIKNIMPVAMALSKYSFAVCIRSLAYLEPNPANELSYLVDRSSAVMASVAMMQVIIRTHFLSA